MVEGKVPSKLAQRQALPLGGIGRQYGLKGNESVVGSGRGSASDEGGVRALQRERTVLRERVDELEGEVARLKRELASRSQMSDPFAQVSGKMEVARAAVAKLDEEKPWDKVGMKKSTYYRHLKQQGRGGE